MFRVIGKRDDLSPDETPLEVGVNGAGGIVGRVALTDRPGTHLLLARREEADRAGGPIGGRDDLVAVKLLNAVLLQKRAALVLWKLEDIDFVPKRYREDLDPGARHHLIDDGVSQRGVFGVDHRHEGFGAEEAEAADDLLIVGIELESRKALAALGRRLEVGDDGTWLNEQTGLEALEGYQAIDPQYFPPQWFSEDAEEWSLIAP